MNNKLKINHIKLVFVSFFLIFTNQICSNSIAQENDAEFEKEFSKFESEINKGSIHDPFENFNRKVYKFNDTIDSYFIEHIARAYQKSIPKKARVSIRSFLDNLTLPISARRARHRDTTPRHGRTHRSCSRSRHRHRR